MRAHNSGTHDLIVGAPQTETLEERKLRALYDEVGVWQRYIERVARESEALYTKFKGEK